MLDLAIIGGGPAAVAAGIYAARKKLRTLVLTQSLGGQSIDSPEIQNWIGEPSISGKNLSQKLEKHLRAYEGEDLEIKTNYLVNKVKKVDGSFSLETNRGESFETKTILLATGGKRRKLEVKGATEFEQKGVTYCASCDGPLFAGQDLVVVGGGNAGFSTASELLAYAKSVTLLEAMPEFHAEPIIIQALNLNPKFKSLKNVEIEEIVGEKFVSGVKYKNKETGEEKELATTGIFVEIGFLPNTDLVKDLVEMTPAGAVKINHQTQSSSLPGIWAAGDCTDSLYHQNNIAAGDGVKAVEDIYIYLQHNF